MSWASMAALLAKDQFRQRSRAPLGLCSALLVLNGKSIYRTETDTVNSPSMAASRRSMGAASLEAALFARTILQVRALTEEKRAELARQGKAVIRQEYDYPMLAKRYLTIMEGCAD